MPTGETVVIKKKSRVSQKQKKLTDRPVASQQQQSRAIEESELSRP